MTLTLVENKTIGDRLAAWLEARGLDLELAARLGLWSASPATGEGWKPDPKGDWVAIPYVVDGTTTHHKYRRLSRKEHAQDKGAAQRFWNEDDITGGPADKWLVITEGEWDAMAAMQAGWPRVVSVPGGAPGGEQARLAYLDPVWDKLSEVEEIIIAADGDGPGANLLRQLAARLGRARCRWVRYPEGCKDLNDVLKLRGVGGVNLCLNEAPFVELTGLYRDAELPPSPEWVIWRPDITTNLDEMIAICPGHISVWTGRPTEGKTTLTQAVFFDIADRYDLRVAWFSGEKDIGRELQPEAAAWLARKEVADLDELDIERGRSWRERHLIYIAEPDGEQTLPWFIERAEAAIRRHGCSIIVLDPWGDIEHDYDTRQYTEHQYTGYVLTLLLRMARKFDVHVAIVAHPTKMKGDDLPGGYDISGSSYWFNKAYLGVTVARVSEDGVPVDERAMHVRVWKSKVWTIMGRPGDAYLMRAPGGRFRPWTEQYSYRESFLAKGA